MADESLQGGNGFVGLASLGQKFGPHQLEAIQCLQVFPPGRVRVERDCLINGGQGLLGTVGGAGLFQIGLTGDLPTAIGGFRLCLVSFFKSRSCVVPLFVSHLEQAFELLGGLCVFAARGGFFEDGIDLGDRFTRAVEVAEDERPQDLILQFLRGGCDRLLGRLKGGFGLRLVEQELGFQGEAGGVIRVEPQTLLDPPLRAALVADHVVALRDVVVEL